ncbi:MAG: TetR/AcrR family transcriptional regulator [Acidobacteriota bacterium]|nr:TetR/AcrR family transcriptional regulator [Acidobacteriota bacterium]
MGRPKKYDREKVLKAAMTVFWNQGFAHTSLQDLEKATGVNKSGLYTEFNSKDDIFVSSLEFYYGNRGSGEILIREPLGWKNIEDFFLFIGKGWSGQYGCLNINSMREIKILPAKAKKMVKGSRSKLVALLEDNIAAEQTKMPARKLAEIAATFFSGFCIEQNLKISNTSAAEQIDDFMNSIRAM